MMISMTVPAIMAPLLLLLLLLLLLTSSENISLTIVSLEPYSFNPFCAGTDFRRQNLTSIEASKVDLHTETNNTGIQIKRKELTKAFMTISKLKIPFGLLFYLTNILALKGLS